MNTFTTRPTLSGTFGMVGSTHWIASAVAMRTLEAGGNAFDAAAAGAFTLHVVEPHLNGPAGEVPAIVAQPGRPARVLMGQGPAPEAATPEHLRGLGLQLVPGSGPIAAAVPGAFDAWLLLLRDLGTADVADVFEPAIGYARSGVPVLPQITATISAARSVFEQHWPTSAATWLPGGRVPQPGELLRNPVWADTLERLLASAGRGDREARIDAVRRTWREGFVAESIEEFCATPFRDASGADHAGLLTVDDLAGYRAGWEEDRKSVV